MEGRGEYSEKNKGMIGTIVFHTIVLLLLIFLGFFTPLPLPGEEGILVNFGDSENGLGDREPSPARNKKQTPPPPKREEKKVTPPPVKTTPPPPVSQPEPEPAKEVAMTQDYEKTVAINAADKKKKEEERKRQAELDKQRKLQQEADAKAKAEAEAERQRQAEIERAKREEAERQAKAEAERLAREEAERQRKAEEERKINDINSRWHEKIGFDEMTDHRFLTENRLVQETQFSSGHAVVVNFGSEAWDDDRGFRVRAKDFRTFAMKQE